jgi:integrase
MTEDDQHDESITEIFEDYADYQDGDYIDFKKFLGHYRGDLSKNTLVTYGRALKFIDFDPSADSPEPECLDEDEQEKFDLSQFESLWARRKMKEVVGKGQGKRPTRNRQAYLCWLGLKKYFKAIGEAKKIDELPSSDAFDNKKSSGRNAEKRDEDKYEKVSLEEHQVREMMESADEKMEVALILMYFGGMRSFELLNAKHNFFDFTKADRISVRVSAKYAKGRRGNREPERLYIKKEFQEKLQNYILKVHKSKEKEYKEFLKEVDNGEYLFNFKQETDKNFKDLVTERWRLWEEIRELAGNTSLDDEKAENLSSHDFRGSQIEKVYNASKDLKRTASVARHGSSETTEKHYLQTGEEEKLDTYKQAFEE